MRGLEKASSRQLPVDPSSTSTFDLCWMLPSASVLARKHEERVQKAFSVDHHGPGDARLSHSAKGIYGELGDTVLAERTFSQSARSRVVSGAYFRKLAHSAEVGDACFRKQHALETEHRGPPAPALIAHLLTEY